MTAVSPRRAAHHAAYELFEAVQSERREEAFAAIAEALATARRQAWPEVEIVLEGARLVHDVVDPARSVSAADVTPLCERAEAEGLPALQAVALALRALVSAGTGDSTALMGDAARAVALLDDPLLPALDRSTGYVVAAAVFNTLRLWELVDELYSRAAGLGATCEVPAMAAAIGVNRVLTRVEWAAALLEDGDVEQCHARLDQATAAVPAALALDLPPLWRHDVAALAAVAELLRGTHPGDVPGLEACRQALVDNGDIEAIPLLDAATAWAWWRAGERSAARMACDRLTASTSASAASPTFPLWVRAQVLGDLDPTEATLAAAEHAALLVRLRSTSREAVLVAARAQIAAERHARDHERLVRAANTDPLTGLHNRRAFDSWLGEAGGSAHRVTALLLMDVDGFKQVNDGHGHDSGDEVLRRIGHLLAAAVRPGDLAVRHGGDEFAVLLADADLTPAAAAERARDLLDAVGAELWAEVSPDLVVTASVGVALSLTSGSDPADLYRSADAALYAAKRTGAGLVVSSSRTAENRPAWA